MRFTLTTTGAALATVRAGLEVHGDHASPSQARTDTDHWSPLVVNVAGRGFIPSACETVSPFLDQMISCPSMTSPSGSDSDHVAMMSSRVVMAVVDERMTSEITGG